MAIVIKQGKAGQAEAKEVGKWLTRIKLAEKFRNAEGRKQAWLNAKRYYQNFFKEDIVSVNLIFSHGRQLIPMIYFKNPVVECTALRPDYVHRAKILEAVDNMLLDKMRVKEQLKLIIQDAYLYDYGVRKVGYDSEFGYDPTGSLWEELFKELGIELTEEERLEYNTYVIKEFPFFLRVPPRRFLVDPDVEGPTLDTAVWCAEEFYRPLEDVMEDDRYTVPKDLKATYVLNEDPSGNVVLSPKKEGYSTSGGGRKSDVERVKLYEIWDKKTRKVYVVAEECKNFLREQEDVWDLENFFPYDRLCFNPVSDEHYSTSDAMYVEKQQLEYNDIVTQEMIHRRKENTKWVSRRNVLAPQDKEKFEQGKPGILIEIDGVPGVDLQAVTSGMSADIYRTRQDCRNDFQEILAMGRNQLAQELGRRKTASEAMLINQYTELRNDERRDIVADFLQRAIQDINRIVFKFWDTPTVVKLVGEEGAEWAEWTGDKLEGEYAIKIVPNSTLPMTKEMHRMRMRQAYMDTAGNPMVDLREMTRVYLDSFEEFDTSKVVLPAPGTRPSMADFRPGKPRYQEKEPQPATTPPEPTTAMIGGELSAQGGREKGGR